VFFSSSKITVAAIAAGRGRRSMSRPVDIDKPNVSTPGRGRRHGPRGSPNKMDVRRKLNNAIGYTYPDGVATAVPSPFDLVKAAIFFRVYQFDCKQ